MPGNKAWICGMLNHHCAWRKAKLGPNFGGSLSGDPSPPKICSLRSRFCSNLAQMYLSILTCSQYQFEAIRIMDGETSKLFLRLCSWPVFWGIENCQKSLLFFSRLSAICFWIWWRKKQDIKCVVLHGLRHNYAKMLFDLKAIPKGNRNQQKLELRKKVVTTEVFHEFLNGFSLLFTRCSCILRWNLPGFYHLMPSSNPWEFKRINFQDVALDIQAIPPNKYLVMSLSFRRCLRGFIHTDPQQVFRMYGWTALLMFMP